MKIHLNEKEMEIKVKLLDPKRGDVIRILQPKTLDDPQFDQVLQGFADAIMNTIGFAIMTVGVKKENELTLLDEEAMKGYGWYRKPVGTKLEEWLAKYEEWDMADEEE